MLMHEKTCVIPIFYNGGSRRTLQYVMILERTKISETDVCRSIFFNCKNSHLRNRSGLEVIKLEFILRLKIKRNDWLLADTCPQAANHCALF